MPNCALSRTGGCGNWVRRQGARPPGWAHDAYQIADIRDVSKRFEHAECFCDRGLGQYQFGAFPEFLVQLLAGEGPVRAAAIALVGLLDEAPSVVQIHFDDAANFIEALGLDSRIEDGLYASHHPLDRRTAHEFIGELMYSGFPANGNGRQHERGRELCLELALSDLISQWV